ncbi:MAG TPA: peptide-methionine (S)-S-oxide reductase MsrA [Oscillospiraceae bacterium]|nr:peptide-methionine (S)-S-oxide reductase MsrA [Oscillospiraceae bacterium]
MNKEIYFAGGCFWGVEKYFSLIKGVVSTGVGYANGNTENPTYRQVCTGDTGFVEAVKVTYNSAEIKLEELLYLFFEIIDPTSLNKQGNDVGSQYRSGIYYLEEGDREKILTFIEKMQLHFETPIVTEVLPLKNFYPAEDYHRAYLDKNPNGYCHIGPIHFKRASEYGKE